MIQTQTNIIKKVLLIIIYLMISVIIITIGINQNSIQCQGDDINLYAAESEQIDLAQIKEEYLKNDRPYIIRPISIYDFHHIPVGHINEGGDKEIIPPYLGKITFGEYDLSDTLFTKIYSKQTLLCDLRIEFTYNKNNNNTEEKLKLIDYGPRGSEGEILELPIKKEYVNNHRLVIDYKSGDQIQAGQCNCPINTK